MQYLGSKNRIAKYIIPIMLTEKKENQYWVEPFVGGANIIDKIKGKRIGNDINKYLISLLIAVRDGYIPPKNISKQEYYDIKLNPDEYPDELVAFVGYLCSFGGKLWGGYAHNTKGDNYAARGCRCLQRQAEKLKGIEFYHGDYTELKIPKKSFIYCDPPYEGTTKYKNTNNFNHSIFWDWCRKKTKEGHTVFVSEYNAPNDFECVKSIHYKTILNRNQQSERVEKLFKYIGDR